MNRTNYINEITKYAARFVYEVEGFNATNQYHINIHSENFLIPVLNEIFDISLENVNANRKKNFPAIDLADYKNRVAFQITATSDLNKIKDSLTKFFQYNLNEYFDLFYFYILTQKKASYNEEHLKEIIDGRLNFSVSDHILDKDDILKRINNLTSSTKIQAISKIYELEFSEAQIEIRKNKFENGFLDAEEETLMPNLLKISFPEYMYKAQLDIDEQSILESLNDYLISKGRKPVKSIEKGKIVKKALRNQNCKVQDWLLNEKWIFTFTDLYDNSTALSHIIDKGTITPINCLDFYSYSDDNMRVFKHLLRNTLIELCRLKGIEFYKRKKKELFRFANDSKKPGEKLVKWKGKKEATKTVIFEIRNKKDSHLICFRNLAFKGSFYNQEENWFLVLNPDWSFTNPGGYRQSRFESSYLSGLKKLENNKSVFNYYRFFRYFLEYQDLFTSRYDNLKIRPIEPLIFIPRLNDLKWNPLKAPTKKLINNDIEMDADDELSDNTLFE